MKKYSCCISYEDNGAELRSFLFFTVLKVLGFTPRYLSAFIDEFSRPLDDIAYDEELFFSLLNKSPGRITLKNQMYDEGGGNYWFRISFLKYASLGSEIIMVEWSNAELDFLLRSNEFKSLISKNKLICCYCFDQYDSIKQSDQSLDSFERNYPGEAPKLVKDDIGNIVVDVSEHWGRVIDARGILFSASPLMWFGESFFRVISKEKLMGFSHSSMIRHGAFDVVFIYLFDLYDDASLVVNRSRQKEFWGFFDLQKKVEEWEKNNPVDLVKILKDRIAAKNSRRKK